MRTRTLSQACPTPSKLEGKTLLAIDPGPVTSQWLRFTPEKLLTAHVSNDELADALRADQFCVTHIAIELIACYGMPVGKEVFETCYFIGKVMEICRSRGQKVIPVYRSEVKMALCFSPRAKDANVRQALIDTFGQPGTKKKPGGTFGISGHAWSALAIAWYARKLIDSR